VMAERRSGGERRRGLDSSACAAARLEGDGSRHVADGGWVRDSFQACLAAVQTMAQPTHFQPNRFRPQVRSVDWVKDPVAYRFEIHGWPSRRRLLLLNGLSATQFAAPSKGQPEPLSTCFILPP